MSATVDTRTEVRSFQVDIPEANIDDPVGNAFAPPAPHAIIAVQSCTRLT